MGRPRTLLGILVGVLVALIVVSFLLVVRVETPSTLASPTPTATRTATQTATPTATATATGTGTAAATQIGAISGPCQNMPFHAGDVPIVAPRRSGQHLQVALDAVRPGQNGGNRWLVRFFVPEGAPGAAEIPLRATVTGPAGPLQTGTYEAGPPNSETATVTQPVTLQPCAQGAPPVPGPFRGTVLVGVQTAPVRSGTYTLTWSDIRLPEGGTRTETWTVTLTCEFSPGPAQPPSTLCK